MNYEFYEQHTLTIFFANSEFGGTLFYEIRFNFYRTYAMSVFKIQKFPFHFLKKSS